jgi:hypothetical protein
MIQPVSSINVGTDLLFKTFLQHTLNWEFSLGDLWYERTEISTSAINFEAKSGRQLGGLKPSYVEWKRFPAKRAESFPWFIFK